MSIYQGANGEKINKTINSKKFDSKGILKFLKKVCIGYISALPPSNTNCKYSAKKLWMWFRSYNTLQSHIHDSSDRLRSLGPPLLSPFVFLSFSRFSPPLPRPTDLIKIINEITLKLARAQAPGDDTLFAQSRVNNCLLVESMLMAIEAASVFLLPC